MKVVDPRVEIITEANPLKRIELCGRVCYKSENKITEESSVKFIQNIVVWGHTSVLEHSRISISCPVEANSVAGVLDNEYADELHPRIGVDSHGHYTMNVRDYLVAFPDATFREIAAHDNADDYLTVRFICDRAIANELVRHRVFSFSQESTRYVNYKDGIEFIRPVPFEWEKVHHSASICAWRGAMEDAEAAYQRLIGKGCTPQEARTVLPLSTKTELIMTGTHDLWTNMLKLRMDRAAHPQMRYLMGLLVKHELFPKDKIRLPEVDNA